MHASLRGSPDVPILGLDSGQQLAVLLHVCARKCCMEKPPVPGDSSFDARWQHVVRRGIVPRPDISHITRHAECDYGTQRDKARQNSN